MRIVDWKHELAELPNPQPGESVQVGRGTVWRVYKYRAHDGHWSLLYWSL